ncbi:AAA family ATPase [Kitasatospora sp. NPDC051170]|uniref:AAA family ATPase n=1 Tax=Kitasatospora sp. NPDC051170 TaxID=3364056 RepID=UPI00378FB693
MSPDTRPDTGPDAALWERLREVERRVREAVRERRAEDPDPDDPYRGQYLAPEAVERILASDAAVRTAGAAAGATSAAPPPPGTRLARLADAFGLLPVDLDLLTVALAPDLDRRFEQLYGYLNDDLTRRRPTIGLALALCALPSAGAGRFRLSARSPLVAGGLLEVADPERPLLSRELRVPDRVAAHLLGDDEPDAALAGIAHRATPAGAENGLPALSGFTYLLDRSGHAAPRALAALAADGPPPLAVDAAALGALTAHGHRDLVRALAREARLTGAGVVLGPLDRLDPQRPERAALVRDLCDRLDGHPLILHGPQTWDPAWAHHSPVTLTLPPPDTRERARQWALALAHALAAAGAAAGTAPDEERTNELTEAVAAHRLDREQLERAASLAVRTAAAEGRALRPDDLRAAVRAQNAAGLARLARRIEPGVGWDDLVLPAPTAGRLRELVLRARHRDQVLGSWRMRPGGGRGHGVIALFAGESGTGKTMSAEVVAAELGMELYVVDLSTVVDKYVGETEKNLERVFTEAAQVNAVLLFDEADALFGKRSQVKDAHDRHANVETAYLLQRLESFDGIAVLTTNLRANLDEAFTRRIDVIAEFPLPDETQRRLLWDRCLGPHLPRKDDLDLDFCARAFELSGGSIRACAVSAAYLAAGTGAPLGMAQLVAAIVGEYRKLGRLVLESEFGPWLGVLEEG